jgi:hypothetical protein
VGVNEVKLGPRDKWAKRSPIVAAATFANVLERTYMERGAFPEIGTRWDTFARESLLQGFYD